MRTGFSLLILLFTFHVHAAEENWNIRTNPLGLVVGIANLRLDYKLSERWVLGPEFAGLNRRVRGVDLRAGGIGIATMYYFRTAYETSPFLEFGVSGSRIKARAKNASGQEYSSEFTNSSLRVLAGYHWFWHPFNLSLGGGLASNSAGKIEIKDSSGNEVDHIKMAPITLALDFTLGLTF